MSKFNSNRVVGTRGTGGGNNDSNGSGTHPGGAGSNVFPNDPSTIGHIFGDREGHLTDTPAHRAELLAVANDPACYLGEDKRGNHWFARLNEDGTQTWVIARNGTIREGGRNDSPHSWDPATGLSANPNKE